MTSDTDGLNSSSGGSRPLRADAVRNRARILEAAEQVFAEQGATAEVDAVAAAAGVGVGTLYRHFPTKEALVAAILIGRLEQLVEVGRHLIGAESAADALFEFLSRFVDQSAAKQDLLDALAKGYNHNEMFETPAAFATFERLAGVVGELLAAAQAAGEVRNDVSAPDLMGLALGPCMAQGAPFISSCCPQRMLSVIRAGISLEAYSVLP